MLTIYLARHGENEDNAHGILNGHRDKPLTQLGLQQAQKLADNIYAKNIAFDAVYTSPLIRAKQTAKAITAALHMSDALVLPELIERDFGIMTGKKASQIEEYCKTNIIKAENVTYFLNPTNGESFDTARIRARTLLLTLKSQYTSGSILLVGHGDFGKMLFAEYYNVSLCFIMCV
jgi:broad specificity phosphatase PhoE